MMDISQTTASWLSFIVTTIGLGSLITQASVITDKLDPFSATRNEQYLGIWAGRMPRTFPWTIMKPAPIGPRIIANLHEEFCGSNLWHVSRTPTQKVGEAGWTVLLGVFHQERIQHSPAGLSSKSDLEVGLPLPERIRSAHSLLGWRNRPTTTLVRHGSLACIPVDRTTLITLMSITNARPVFIHADAAGYRASYSSYNGHWYIEWPLGSAAIVRFTPMDPIFAANDVCPPTYERRVDRCIQMTTGVVYSHHLKCAFPGRRPSGRYILKHLPKGFTGAHGARHLYNMMGGKAYEVDFLSPCKLDSDGEDPQDAAKLVLPSREHNGTVHMFVPMTERGILAQAMDLMPWSSLSWSIHRGLRDILVEFCKPRMERNREALALFVRDAVLQNPESLEAKGWDRDFVQGHMAEAAAGAVRAGNGKSADLVRVVTDAVLTVLPMADWELDETHYWRNDRPSLDQEAYVALTKCFILEWSTDFDYQIYHKLPTKLYFG